MILTKSKIFLILCLGLIIGVFLGRFVNYEIIAVLAMIFIILGSVFWENKAVLIFAIAGVAMLLGSLRFITDYKQNDIAPFYGQKAAVTGVISEEPDQRSDKTYLTLSKLSINGHAIHSKLLLTVRVFPEYEYGQKLQFEAKISEPKEYPDFSYKNYLSRFGIDAVAYEPPVKLLPGNFGFKPKLYIFRLKEKFAGTLAQILPEPQNSFLGGLLLGAKHSIPQNLTDQFNRTGTSHIVAISGYNITIIAAAIDWVLMALGIRKRISFVLAMFAILVFVVMTGAGASVVRAGIMGALLLIALNTGRINVAANSLAFTAALMLALNPQILAFDVGFQLSFAGLLGIIYVVPLLEPYFFWLPQLLRQYFLATLAAQIFTLPILMFNFGQLSLVALVANVLVLPLVPITMLFGFATGVVGLISAKLALPLTGMTWVLLTYIIKVIGFFAALPFASVNWHINSWFLSAYYFILVLIIIGLYKRADIINWWMIWKPKPKISSSI